MSTVKFSDAQMQFVLQHSETPSTSAYPEGFGCGQRRVTGSTHKKTGDFILSGIMEKSGHRVNSLVLDRGSHRNVFAFSSQGFGGCDG
jgi:hypothetical protein